MDEGGILRPDRLVALILISFSLILLLMFGGGSLMQFTLMSATCLALAAMLAEIGYLRDRKGTKHSAPRFSGPALWLALISCFSMIWSIDAGLSLEKLPVILASFLIFWAMSRSVPKQRITVFFIFQLLSTIILAYSLFEYAVGGIATDGALTLPMQDNASFSALSLFVLALSLSQVLGLIIDDYQVSGQVSSVTKTVLLIASGVGAVISAGALSFTASPLILLLVIFILCVIASVRGRAALLRSSGIIIGAVAAGLLLAYLLTSINPTEEAQMVFLPALKGSVANFLYDLEYMSYHWMTAFRIGLQRFVAGFGLGTFERALPLSYMPADFHPGSNAFSFLMQSFAETGLFGAIAVLALSASALVSLLRRIKASDAEALWLFPPFIALLVFLFIGSSFESPLIALLFFAMTGAVSAGSMLRKGDALSKLNTGMSFVVAIIAVVISVSSIFALNAKQQAETFMGQGRYEEAVPAIRKAIDLNSLDSTLYMYLSSAELNLSAAGVDGHSEDAALRYAEIAVDLSPYRASALQLRGLLLKRVVEDGSWLDDFKQASSFAADDVTASLMIADESLKTGDLAMAGEYIDIAGLNKPLLASGAGTDTYEGINDLSDLIKIEALSYALAVKSADEEEAALRLQNLRDLEEKYPDVHEFIAELLATYGIEDPLH